jgi:opacity protein-like surface antigen
MHDQSPYVVEVPCKWGAGAIAKSGVIFNFSNAVFLDLFANYSYIRINFHNEKKKEVENFVADASNCTFGIGLGYRFGARRSLP